MGQTRTNRQPSETEREQPISGTQVAVIAALLLTAPKPGELATALLALLPAALLARFPKAGAQASLSAASLALQVASLQTPTPGRSRTNVGRTEQTPGITSGDSRGEAVFSAAYAIRAVQRLFRGREDFPAALDAERSYLALHRQAKERRVKAQRVADAMRDLYGTTIFGWRHGAPLEPRPSHAAADGLNVDVSRIPVATGALPAALPGCTCSLVPAFEGAELLR